ncbi:PKD domain-containing protein [Halorussus amylolyticus]|uniref:PKD domain-containing protein n=1 Tax=Halorussus amylolyticus TaxID=1126242 RepID=UPI00192FB550|nr:PKD domain-containing protein [Halorussus amylolyticus]
MTPTSLYTGSTVNGSVVVENTGGGTETYNVSLTLDGSVVAWENGTIEASTTKRVSVRKTLEETGGRTVAVAAGSASATETVTVKNANANYHGGARNLGHYPDQQGPTTEPEEAWSISEGVPHVMQSTIVDGTLYTAFHNGGNLYALDPETGAEKWSANPGGTEGSTWTTPAYADGVLYLGSNDYKLHAIDAATGNELWHYDTQTNVRSAPAVVDGVVYVGSNDGNMTAVNATTGEKIWNYELYQPVLVESNPAVVDDVVYFGGNDDNVTALNATTGEKIWNFTLPDESQSDPTVADGTVFIGSDSSMGETSGDGTIHALDAETGAEDWSYTMAGDVDSGQVYADGVVYAASRGGDLAALDAADGSEVWTQSGTDFRGAPVVANGVVYVSDFGNTTVHAFDADTGDQLWEYDSPTGTLYPTPLVWDNYVYYGSGSHFYALTPPAPSISDVSATNPSGQNLAVEFNSSVALASLSVSVDGPSSTTFTENDFSESGSGPYTYTLSSEYETGADGEYEVSVDTAEDADGADGATGESDSVTIDTTDPTADAGNDQTVAFGDTVSVDAGGSADNLGIADYSWDFGDGNTATGETATNDYADTGEYTVTLTVTDDAGHTDTDTLTVTVEDKTDPTADAGNDQTIDEDAATSFDASGSSDNVGVTGYAWEFGDGNTATGATPTHTYADPGTYTATLTVTDGGGNTDTDSLTVTVEDTTPPTADAGSDQTIDQKTATTFDGSGSTDNDAIDSYDWDFGDGNTSTGANPTHTYAAPGDYTATLTVADGAGHTDTDTLTVTVEDAIAPTVAAGGDRTTDEDAATSFDASGSSDNVGVTGYAWEFGDGNTATGATPSHTYADPGTFIANVTVSDDAGNTNTSAVTVTVNDITPPTADAGADRSADVNENVAFDATDSSDNDAIAAYSWEFGDNDTATGATPTHSYAESGTYTVNLTVTDDVGHTDTESLNVTVTAPPDNSNSRSPSNSGPSDSDDKTTEIVVNASDDADRNETDSGSSVDARVRNAEANSTVAIDLGDASNESEEPDDGSASAPTDRVENVSVTGMDINVTRSGGFTLNVTSRSRTLNGTNASDDSERTPGEQTADRQSAESLSKTDREFANETGARSAGQVVVNHSISDDDIDGVTFTFEVRKTYLDAVGDPESVALYRNEQVRWRTLSTEQVAETDTHYVFEAVSPGLSEFTVGVSSPLFEVREVALDSNDASPGEQVEVRAVVENVGAAEGTYDLTVRADGETTETKSVTVPARSNRTVTIPVEFETAGTYDVSAAGKSAGAIQVETARATTESAATTTEQPSEATTEQSGEVTTEATTSESGFGWARLLFGVVLVGAGIVLYRRRQEDGAN